MAQFRRRHPAPRPSSAIARRAFDLGITHFDLANNYGPPPGSAEEAFGEILRTDFNGFRDELIISSKAGYGMWPGPYGEWGSRKYLIASCDQSLKRMGLDYVDIFYSHRFDPDTPLEETMGALDHIVRSGRALYVGISSYNSERTREAVAILKDLGTPCLIHQPSYSMINRWIERDGLKATLAELGIGSIAFSPLAQGMLTDEIPQGHPRGQPRRAGQVAESGADLGQGDRRYRQAEQHRQTPRPEPGADGAGLGAARGRHHHGADRRLAAPSRSRIASAPSATSTSPPKNLPRSTNMPMPTGSTSGRGRRKASRREMIRNPILPGFHPDPSLCRVGDGLVHRHLDLRMVSRAC